MATSQEIDMTTLCRSLKLLHSPDPDSADQLLAIVEETLKHKYGNKKPLNLSGLGLNKKCINVEDSSRSTKRMKLDGSSRSTSPLYADCRSSDSDSGDATALEILDEDLTCIVCREMAVGADNNLVECSGCRSLYHQDCHDPRITLDVNDHRSVWYCANCKKKTKNKVGTSSSPKESQISSTGHSAKSSKSSLKSSTSSSKPFGAFHTSGKTTSSSSSSKHSSSGHSSSKTNIIPMPKLNISADKRLQLMKKNAAKKHEKRKLTK